MTSKAVAAEGPAVDYITAAGLEALKTEHRELVLRRRTVVAALSAAVAEGDRSENAEYIYRKKELREVDRRLRYLDKRLKVLRVPPGRPHDTQRVYFGATVTLEDDAGAARTLRIVGSDETDPERGWISLRSPMAKALLGRRLDDEVTVRLPHDRSQHLYIMDIHYE